MMYNQKHSRLRVLRPLALVPALGAALWVSQLPAVASVLSEIETWSLYSADSHSDKVSTNNADMQISEAADAAMPGGGDDLALADAVASDAVSAAAPAKASKSQSVDVAEEMPSFPGGETAMMQYLRDNIKWPEGNTTSGRVIVGFVVKKDGSIGDVAVKRSVNPVVDAEAVRVVSSMPRWTPGKSDGKPVDVQYLLPIQFSTKGDAKDSQAPQLSADKDESTSTMSTEVTMTVDGESPLIYINGVLQEGGTEVLQGYDAKDIESINIDKSNGSRPSLYVTLKKK